jgi:RsiW-degrading membrane proteinase PrsW (M82 family)
MSRRRDPVQRREDDDSDLQGVATWEPQTFVDKLLYRTYSTLFRVSIVVAAVVLLVWQIVEVTKEPLLLNPVIVTVVFLAAVPALVLATYVWYRDVAPKPQPVLLAVTFVFGFVFVGFAGILDDALGTLLTDALAPLGLSVELQYSLIFLVVVAPVEESLKLLAVHIYAYRSEQFDTVISGAVYGAAAGLGFAAMENAFRIADVITQTESLTTTARDGGRIATVRAYVGPGHVIYSAFAGYYLGLARFNKAYAGTIILKGLLTAVGLHATYNILASKEALYVPGTIADVTGLSETTGLFSLIVAYNGLLIALLIYKLSHYRKAYHDAHGDNSPDSALTEFERTVPTDDKPGASRDKTPPARNEHDVSADGDSPVSSQESRRPVETDT